MTFMKCVIGRALLKSINHFFGRIYIEIFPLLGGRLARRCGLFLCFLLERHAISSIVWKKKEGKRVIIIDVGTERGSSNKIR